MGGPRLVSPSPRRGGQLSLARGQEKEAAADFARAVQRDDKDTDALVWHARALLATGDQDGYRRACAALLKHFDAQKEPSKATVVARTALLTSNAVADLVATLKLLPENPQDAATQTTRGGLLLRAGKPAEAIAELQKAAAQRRAGEAPVAELLLALLGRDTRQAGKPRRFIWLDRRALSRVRQQPA